METAILNLCGLTVNEAQYAIRPYKSEIDSAKRRAKEQREAHEANLRRQGYTEEQISRR